MRIAAWQKGSWSAAIAFSLFLLIWIVWATDIATRFTAPGLLDDGSAIADAGAYRAQGFFHVVAAHFLQIFNPASARRFYELQEGLLGFYRWAFGPDLRFWYLMQFGWCLLTAAAGFSIVWSFDKNLSPGMVAAFSVLTISPLADAVRANFGKGEDIMTFAFVAGVAFLVRLRFRRAKASTASGLAAVIGLAAGSIVFMTLGALGKESGKILATFPLLFVVLEFAAQRFANACETGKKTPAAVERIFLQPRDDCRPPLPFGFAIFSGCLGVVVLGVSAYAFRMHYDRPYFPNYFILNFDPNFILANVRYYLSQCPDEFILLGMLGPLILFGFRRPSAWACYTALAGIAAVYLALLTTFHFQISYYVYVPAVLTAIAYGLAFACASSGYRVALLAALGLSRIDSIPNIYFQAAGQRYADYVSFEAMAAAARSDAPRVIMLDLDEDNQAIQEWNLLRRFFFDARLPPVFGGPPEFGITEYQTRFRDGPSAGAEAATAAGAPADSVPRVGDLVAFRSGSMTVGNRVLRAVFPFHQDESKYLSILDQTALTPFATVGGQIPAVTPYSLGVAEFDLHWNFYRVSSPPRYLIFGRQPAGWLRQKARVRIFTADPGKQLALHIEIPGWVPYHYPLTLTASMAGRTVARLIVTYGSFQTLALPLDQPGDIEIEADDCSGPEQVGIAGPVQVCYLFSGAQVQELLQ
jgi:hypothetical protein